MRHRAGDALAGRAGLLCDRRRARRRHGGARLALYKHFPSKHALLEAALRTHLDSAATGAAQLDEMGLAAVAGMDRSLLQPMVMGLGRWFLDEMDRLEALTCVIEHDGRRLAELTAEVKTNIVDLSYHSAAAFISAVAPEASDAGATAVLLLGALVALRRTAWTFGSPPLGIDDDRALTAWAELTLTTLGALDDEERT